MSAKKTERLTGTSGVSRAAEILRHGGTVAFPTETVYGLGANALDATAVEKIFAAKERPGWDPVIVHVADEAMLRRAAEVPDSMTEVVAALKTAFWPGPLTLLLPRTSEVPDVVTAGRRLVGVRMPAHPLALELIRQAGVPVAAPSANRFGRTSPTTAAHVLEDLDGRIDAVLDGGPTSVGVESTVIGPDESRPGCLIQYRPGGVSLERLVTVCGQGMVTSYVPDPSSSASPQSLPSPGVGIRHYAPRAKLVLVSGISQPVEDGLAAAVNAFDGANEIIGVLLPDGWNASRASLIYRWGPWRDTETLARRLFAGLRQLDENGATVIVCPVPETGGIGEAIRDRLAKAAQKKP
ncbi:MAG: L-threonylcarbamoyladenylate synthase [Acidobacteriaceae bacterium]|nr:L-threonylcarbamoyladenylate synthase [Acidobacteriaceae bacterium]